ncbi:MAG TPA: hypothetical protein VES19_14630, partial [Candidatus Limnocylindrales bacterium]|nr:hypothetical protein [Candidatus Limnocylindrales bacterium]
MRGFERRPSTRSVVAEGRPATALVLLVIAALVATCGGPAPSAPANGSGGPAATQVAGGTPEAPGSTPASPGTSPEPPEGAWTR